MEKTSETINPRQYPQKLNYMISILGQNRTKDIDAIVQAAESNPELSEKDKQDIQEAATEFKKLLQ